MTTDGIRALLKTLEAPECLEDSAVMVGTQVISSLAASGAPRENVELLSSAVASTLQHRRETTLVLEKFRENIESRLVLVPQFRTRILRTLDAYIAILRAA